MHLHRHRRIPRWTVARRLVAATFLAAFVLASSGEFAAFRGNLALTETLGCLPLVDPLAALELLVAGRGVSTTVLAGSAALILVALVLGPVFCAWVCPLGLMLDLNDAVRRWARHLLHRKPKLDNPVSSLHGLRYGVLGTVLGFVLISRVPVFTAISPIRLVADTLVSGMMLGIWILAALLIIEWFLPRLWCRVLCPLGALYAAVGTWAPWRIRIAPALAGLTPCSLCTRHCGMGIKVMEDYTLRGAIAVDDPACIRCGACLDHCPRSVLRLGWRRPQRDE